MSQFKKRTIEQFEAFLRAKITESEEILALTEHYSVEEWTVEQHNNKWYEAKELIQESEAAIRMISLFVGGGKA